jgi:bisphosphoglycerate-dependent phosphoglycerate mutase
MRGYQRILVLFFGFQGTKIDGFVANRNPSTSIHTRDAHFRLSETKVEKEEGLDVLINGVPGQEDDNPNDLPEINGYSMPLGQKSSGYSAFLDRSRLPWLSSNKMKMPAKVEVDEDGYVDLKAEQRPFVERILRAPFNIVSKLGGRKVKEPGTLILVRHGESNWNKNKTFTGWADPDLTEQGKREVEHAARLLMEGGYKIDVVFTSRLTRAIRSCWILLQEFNEVYLPVFKSWRLNERMYGALTGLGKTETAETLGQELVQEWRGSLRSRPPALKVGDKYWPGRDRKYADLTKDQVGVKSERLTQDGAIMKTTELNRKCLVLVLRFR